MVMNMKNNKFGKRIYFVALLLPCICACSNSGSKGGDEPLAAYEGKDFHFSSSKGDDLDCLNELNKRMLRYDEDTRVGDIEIPEGVAFNMGWETSALVWHNATEEGVGKDCFSPIYSFLQNAGQDDYGYIYDLSLFRESSFQVNNSGLWNLPQGWPFPYWKTSVDNLLTDSADYDNVHFTTFEFDSANEPTSENWECENGKAEIGYDGYMNLSLDSSIEKGKSLTVTNTRLSDYLRLCGGIDTTHASFIEIDLDFSSTNLDDFYFLWQTKEGGDTWYRASSKEYMTVYNDSFASYGAHTYWPMYLDENWAGKTVTSIGIEFAPKEGEALNLSNARINYIRPAYDTRQPQFTFQWLDSFYDYVVYKRDLDALAKLMPKARRALLNLTHCLKGESGLLNLDYLYGHNGIGTTINEDGTLEIHPGQGIGSSYWDVLALPTINLESNAYFYGCVKKMAVLEKACEDYNLDIEGTSIKNRSLGQEKVVYDYTSSKLTELASLIKATFEKDIKPAQQADGSWVNEGGLWNPATGRFALGVRESDGAILDHGYIYFNEQAICAGLGSSAQRLSTMNWIDGKRIVEGDDSTGEDIYFYEFAPRFTTKDNSEQINFTLVNTFFEEGGYYDEYGSLFSRQVQCGGAVLCWSYYDLLARAEVLGRENALSRLEGVASWYKKVQEGTSGTGTDFFADYYETLESEDWKGYYVLQNAEGGGPGALGLDGEFLENSLFARSLPSAILGMEVDSFDHLSFCNDSLEGLNAIRADNLKFGNATYSVKMSATSFEISNLKGGVFEKTKLSLRFKKPSGGFTVEVDGKISTDYAVEGDYISMELPLTNIVVNVK